MEEDKNNRQNDNEGILHKKWIIPGAVAVILVIFALLFFLRPQTLGTITFNAVRIKNTISYYVFHSRIHFYYLEMEKNGKDIHSWLTDAVHPNPKGHRVMAAAIFKVPALLKISFY